ncbi:MAG: hypothetical protein KF691_10350 [Phycisphaeraceae bacterium]|nr:hypothetical protein [Phycisphaeraceae bacterium]
MYLSTAHLILATLSLFTICHAARAVTNSAHVIVFPHFGGTPIDITNTNSGIVDAAGSTTGGMNSSGDASAHTKYGFIRLITHANGALLSTATGIFEDTVTINAPGVPTGTAGIVTYRVRAAGNLNAWSGSAVARWYIKADLGTGGPDLGVDGQFNSPDAGNPGYQGAPIGAYTPGTSFQFGVPSTLRVELSATALASFSINGPGAAAVDPSLTVVWDGIQSVVLSNGTPVPLFTVTSGSGKNWALPSNTCPADLNHDGQVDDSDFVTFAAAYNILDCIDPAMPAGCPADLNGDGLVDDGDFVEFVFAYNALVCP